MSDIYKTSDIRGIYPRQIDDAYAYKLGIAFSEALGAKSVGVAHDSRLSSPQLYAALIAGIRSAGAEAVPLGLCPSEIVYYVAGKEYFDLGVCITASHNPPQYNGFKIVRKGGGILARRDGLADLKEFIDRQGEVTMHLPDSLPPVVDFREDYRDYVMDLEAWPPLDNRTIVVDAGNGVAGEFWKVVEKRFAGRIIYMNAEPDGRFPARDPDPYVPGSLDALVTRVRETGADIGLAYDGDADRVAAVSSSGQILSGSDILAVIAGRLLARHAGEGTVACNQVMSRRTLEYLDSLGWERYLVPVGHGLIKTIMRRDPSLLFVGETSGHFYYRSFFCADSAFLTSMVLIDLAGELDEQLQRLSTCWCRPEKEPRVGVPSFDEGLSLCREASRVFIASDEVEPGSFELACETDGRIVTGTDTDIIREARGIRCDTPDAWFCLRPSGTEPIVRITVEAKSREKLVRWLYKLEQFITPE